MGWRTETVDPSGIPLKTLLGIDTTEEYCDVRLGRRDRVLAARQNEAGAERHIKERSTGGCKVLTSWKAAQAQKYFYKIP